MFIVNLYSILWYHIVMGQPGVKMSSSIMIVFFGFQFLEPPWKLFGSCIFLVCAMLYRGSDPRLVFSSWNMAKDMCSNWIAGWNCWLKVLFAVGLCVCEDERIGSGGWVSVLSNDHHSLVNDTLHSFILPILPFPHSPGPVQVRAGVMHSSRPPGGHRSTSVSSSVYVCVRQKERERERQRERKFVCMCVVICLGFPLNRWPAFFPLHLTNVIGSRRPSVRVCVCARGVLWAEWQIYGLCAVLVVCESLYCCHWNMSARVCFFSCFKCWLIVTCWTCLAHDCVMMFC